MIDEANPRDCGPYSLGRVLGRGGMSTVYRAIDTRTGAEVACKVLTRRASTDPALRGRFARRVCAIDHPNVVPIREIGESGGILYVAMELVRGTDAQAELDRGPMAPVRALAVFAQVCSALAALHRRGLMHLDVKPANVLLATARPGPRVGAAVTEDGRGTTRDDRPVDHVYVLDYGLLDASTIGPELFVGTPNYASPEHLRGLSIDSRSDVYSLTCVLFALLAGRPPFAGRLTDVITGHLAGRIPSLAAITGLPVAIDTVIRRGLAPEPADRPGCPEALATAARMALTAL